jgi:hypothetical protein
MRADEAEAALMPRWAMNRDLNDLTIFNALMDAHCNPIRGRDADIFCRHRDGYGVLIEVKGKYGTLRPIQEKLQELFQDRYKVVRNVTEALQACGITNG